jgi:hypothetical protein
MTSSNSLHPVVGVLLNDGCYPESSVRVLGSTDQSISLPFQSQIVATLHGSSLPTHTSVLCILKEMVVVPMYYLLELLSRGVYMSLSYDTGNRPHTTQVALLEIGRF